MATKETRTRTKKEKEISTTEKKTNVNKTENTTTTESPEEKPKKDYLYEMSTIEVMAIRSETEKLMEHYKHMAKISDYDKVKYQFYDDKYLKMFQLHKYIITELFERLEKIKNDSFYHYYCKEQDEKEKLENKYGKK